MPDRMGNLIAAGPYRSKVQSPSLIVDALNIKPGMNIVELGCGSGFYTIAVAKAVQSDGLVYAVDIQQGMLDKLKVRMEREDVKNIIPILADAEGEIPLDDGIADASFSISVIPEIPHPTKALLQLRRLLKNGGLWVDSELILDPDYPLRRTVIKWARQAGFELKHQLGNSFRYVLVFVKVE